MNTRLLLTAGAVALLAGCAGASHDAASMPPATGSSQLTVRGVLPTGNVVRFAGPARVLSQLAPIGPARARVEKDLFVSDTGSNVFELKNKTYHEVGDITSGISGSDGVFVDKKGNVYVANVDAADVTEYKRGKGSPICTYSASLRDPITVTVDNSGNVYVADFNSLQNPGYIDKYAQCSNTVAKQYDVSSGPEGVAVDSSGDIFVSYFGSAGGNFEEFVGGSTTPTALGATVSSPAGLILDKHGNLIADDQSGNIDVIAPPYGSATVLESGLSDPFHCALNKKENLLFNANHGSTTVTVYKYPSGSLIYTIGTSNGIDGAEGVGESPDAVF